MYLTKRKISPYTNSDIIIGIFDSYEIAIIAKRQYIEICKTFDKWARQAYKEVNVESDITIQDISGEINFDYNKTLKLIYVISRFDEGFGQIVRSIESYSKTEDYAKKYCNKKKQ